MSLTENCAPGCNHHKHHLVLLHLSLPCPSSCVVCYYYCCCCGALFLTRTLHRFLRNISSSSSPPYHENRKITILHVHRITSQQLRMSSSIAQVRNTTWNLAFGGSSSGRSLSHIQSLSQQLIPPTHTSSQTVSLVYRYFSSHSAEAAVDDGGGGASVLLFLEL